MLIEPFHLSTCEDAAKKEKPIVCTPIPENPFEPFLIQDPFGLRKAIVPVLKRSMNGDILGMGTAFHIDGWGTFLTADHVIDFAREHQISASDWAEIQQNSTGDHAVLLLGIRLAFGRGPIPKEAFSLVEYMAFPMKGKHNPSTNRMEPERAADLAVMRTTIQSDDQNIPQTHFLPVRSSSVPSVGETVLAVGFPELNCQRLDDSSQRAFLTEKMYGAYGKITAIHPRGRGKNQSAPTPVFEIECNWRQGMSGGPVFNSTGEVIGLISSAMALSPNGVGWATCLGAIPDFDSFVPTLDTLNPGWRRGWAVLRSKPWHLAGFFQTETDAQHLACSMNMEYQVKYGASKFGTDDFLSCTS